MRCSTDKQHNCLSDIIGTVVFHSFNARIQHFIFDVVTWPCRSFQNRLSFAIDQLLPSVTAISLSLQIEVELLVEKVYYVVQIIYIVNVKEIYPKK